MASSVTILAYSATLTNRPVLFGSVKIAENKTLRPDFIAPIYGPIGARMVPQDAPPAFFAIGLDDPIFAAGRPIEVIDLWRKVGGLLRVTSTREAATALR